MLQALPVSLGMLSHKVQVMVWHASQLDLIQNSFAPILLKASSLSGDQENEAQ